MDATHKRRRRGCGVCDMTPRAAWKSFKPTANIAEVASVLRSGRPLQIFAEPPPMPYSSSPPWPVADDFARRHFAFTLRYVTDDQRSPRMYGVYGQSRGDAKWEMVDGPWRVGMGPYDAE